MGISQRPTRLPSCILKGKERGKEREKHKIGMEKTAEREENRIRWTGVKGHREMSEEREGVDDFTYASSFC